MSWERLFKFGKYYITITKYHRKDRGFFGLCIHVSKF